ncbi:MAG: MFS transporter [Deltaproteobacteria bacterium]|nr:MFS transporter [Deltaproteobacteria bacterium]
MNVTHGYRWTIMWLMTFCLFAHAITFQSIPPILGILVTTFGISYARAGGLMSLYSLPRIFLALPGGVLVDRYGAKRIGSVALLAMALGTTTVSLAGSYWVLGLGRLVAGAGVTVFNVISPMAITSWFHDREIGLSMGVFNTAMPFGTILALNFMGVIALRFGWRTPISITLVSCILALCLFLMLYRKREYERHVNKEKMDLSTTIKKAGLGIWLVGSAWALFNASQITYFTYAPDYFITLGEDITHAGLLASYPMWGAMILSPLVGIMIDKIGKKWLMISVSFGAMAVLYYLMPRFPAHSAMYAISLGVFAALLPPAIFALPAELLPPSVMGLGFGIIGTSVGVGAALGPYVAGSLRDVTGNYMWSFNAMAIFAVLGVLTMLLLDGQKGKAMQHNRG